MTQEEKSILEERIVDVLKTVYDPEIPVNIYDLGLIYKVELDDDFNLKILMTMTAPDCPEAEYMFLEVKQMTECIDGIKSVNVELTFDPPWDFNNLSDDVKLELGLM